MSLSRRRRVLVLLMAPVLAFAACGGSDSGSGGDDAASTGAAAAFPVTIEHQYGSTTIESEPKRVVSLGLSDQDALLALGVKPIAVSEWYDEYPSATWPWAQDELGDAKPVVLNEGVRNESEPPIEEIASLRPDLIVSLYNGTTRRQYELLSRIAPTVVPTKELGNFNITWRDATRITGRAVGREDEANRLVTGLEEKFAATAEANPQFAGQEAVVAERFEPGKSVVRSGKDVRAQFFRDLGFTIPTEVGGGKPDEYGEIEVSDELLDELSSDFLVWNVGPNPEVRKTIEAQGVYERLPVVRDGHVLWIEDPVVSGAFSWGTVLSLDFALDELLPQIRRTVGG